MTTFPEERRRHGRSGPRRRVVLLVDDEPHVTAALQRMLRHEDFDIVPARSGVDGLAVLNSRPVDAIVADHDMPGMNGVRFLAEAARLFPDTVRFMLTGKPTLDIAVAAINEGHISRFFTKPADPFDLALTLRQALEHRELVRHAMRLLARYREEHAVLARLEQDNPGIATLHRDSDGAIVLEPESPQDYDALIEELRRTVGDGAEGE